MGKTELMVLFVGGPLHGACQKWDDPPDHHPHVTMAGMVPYSRCSTRHQSRCPILKSDSAMNPKTGNTVRTSALVWVADKRQPNGNRQPSRQRKRGCVCTQPLDFAGGRGGNRTPTREIFKAQSKLASF